MAGYGQFCPLAQASEVLAERWTPLVIRELLPGGRRFNEIHRGVPLMSATLLSKRLRGLERIGVIERIERSNGSGAEYRLTRAGHELGPVLEGMAVWSERWLRRPISPEDAEPQYVMWTVKTDAVIEELPSERTVVHFRFPKAADKLRYWWLVLERPEIDLCLSDPGFGVDLTVTSTPETLASVIAGDLKLGSAIRSGAIELQGSREAIRGFRRWFGVSPLATVKRPPGRARPAHAA